MGRGEADARRPRQLGTCARGSSRGCGATGRGARCIEKKKFNKKYSNLTKKQKTLIKEYINNISNTNKLREYVDSEVEVVKDTLKTQIKKVDDKVTQIKLTEVVNQIDGLKKGKVVSDKQVVSMMRYYQLIGEIDNVAN